MSELKILPYVPVWAATEAAKTLTEAHIADFIRKAYALRTIVTKGMFEPYRVPADVAMAKHKALCARIGCGEV